MVTVGADRAESDFAITNLTATPLGDSILRKATVPKAVSYASQQTCDSCLAPWSTSVGFRQIGVLQPSRWFKAALHRVFSLCGGIISYK